MRQANSDTARDSRGRLTFSVKVILVFWPPLETLEVVLLLVEVVLGWPPLETLEVVLVVIEVVLVVWQSKSASTSASARASASAGCGL